MLVINTVHCYPTCGTIGIVANSNCRPLLRQHGGLYESVECEHQAEQIVKLIGVREGAVLLPVFDDEEVDGLLEVQCYD